MVEEADQNDDVGLECRECGCKHFYTLYTRPAHANKVLRRRECRHCGRRVTTYESTSQETA